MSRSIVNALKSVAVLVCIASVCVGLLALCNRYFPKYVPILDEQTCAIINGICPTGASDADAFKDGYVVMLYDGDYGASLADFNKSHKSDRAEILCVYGEIKGENCGSFVIESKSAGRDGDVVILVAYKNGTVTGATVKKQNESYWEKLPENVLDAAIGTSGDAPFKEAVEELNGGKTGATVSLTAIDRAVGLSNAFALSYSDAIRQAISKKTAENFKSGVGANE